VPNRVVKAAALIAYAIGAAACSSRDVTQDSTVAHAPIDSVLRSHTDSLMRVNGVVGTAIGECDGSPCIKVLVVAATPELQRVIPKTLEGHKVVIEETGVVRPQR
jgi:hypothetical protein